MLGSGAIVPSLLPIQISLALLGYSALLWEDECLTAIAMVYLAGVRSDFARTIFKLLSQFDWVSSFFIPTIKPDSSLSFH